MADRQGDEWEHRAGLIAALVTPRLFTRLALAVASVLLAELAWRLLDAKSLAALSAALAPACLLCVTAIWSLRSRVDEALSGQDLGAEGYLAVRAKASELRLRLMVRAPWIAICALAAGSSAISQQLGAGVWHWMVLVAGLGVAETAYAYMLTHSWDEQLRDHRDRQRLLKMKREEAEAVLQRMQDSKPSADSPPIGWPEEPDELSAPKH